MARIKGAMLVPRALQRSPGRFIINNTKYGIHAQAWPRKRGKATQGGGLYHQKEFALVASWASNPEPIMFASSIELAKGSDNVPRDILMMASFGTFYDITLPDGTQTVPYRMVAPNAQYILDQVTSAVGSILYRAQIGWVGLGPGNHGYVLTMQNGAPLWMPASGGGGGGAQATLIDTVGANSYAIPASATTLLCYLVGPGGGGGAGARFAAGTLSAGGGGGGGGAAQIFTLKAAALTSPLTVTIGAGGAGAPPNGTDNSAGFTGSPGGNTILDTGSEQWIAAGGGGGAGGWTFAQFGGSGGGRGSSLGGAGGGSSVASPGPQGQITTNLGALGGGGGAGCTSPHVAFNGGPSGIWATETGRPQNAAQGGNAVTPTPPEPGIEFLVSWLISGGGGGGGNTAAGTAQDGANGGNYGGGGGGGAASLNGNTSGGGGDGANGAALIIAI